MLLVACVERLTFTSSHVNHVTVAATKVQVIGGGPGGLFAARLLKLRHPGWHIEVHEQLAPVETFGFGVGLTARTLTNVKSADADVHAALHAVSHSLSRLRLVTLQDRVEWGPGDAAGGITVGRAALLEVLQKYAFNAGVDVKTGSTFSLAEADADLVIAADGAGSATREKLAGAVSATVELGRGLYIWCGLDRALEGNLFAPVLTDHGMFVTHAYAYSPQRSTVLIETDEQTWRRAGFDQPQQYASEASSDEASLAFLQDAFQPHLDGGQLIGNRSRWLRFRTVRSDRWHEGTTVLLGDAARTAHYSLGSGTKLALEDAIALADSLPTGDAISVSLAEYEAKRRPSAARIQELAHRSHLWWDAFPQRVHRPAASVAFAYLSRGGAVPLAAAAAFEPQIARAAIADFAKCDVVDIPQDDDGLASWVLARPYHGHVSLDSRVYGTAVLDIAPATGDRDTSRSFAVVDVDCADWLSEEADSLVQQCRDAVHKGSVGVILTGSDTRAALLDRLALGERVRSETAAVVTVQGPIDHLADLVDGLVAGRTDLVSVTQEGTTA